MVKSLGKESGIVLAANGSQADYTLTGTGETFIRGYIGTNPRVRYLNSDAKPVYGGYLSVELKSPGRDTVWSYLVTPRRMGPEDIGRNLVGQVIPKLLEAVKHPSKP